MKTTTNSQRHPRQPLLVTYAKRGLLELVCLWEQIAEKKIDKEDRDYAKTGDNYR